MSVGGSSKKQESSQSAASESFISDIQSGYLQSMFGQASHVTNPYGAQADATHMRGELMPGLQAAFGNISGLTDTQEQIDAQSASLQAGLGQLFREEINPAIQTEAVGAGQFGGGRQGVAEGVATGQLADAYTKGYGDIVARANQTATAAGSLMPQLAQAAYNTYQAPRTAGLDVLAQYADVLGAPIVLQRSQAQSGSSAKAGGFSFGLF